MSDNNKINIDNRKKITLVIVLILAGILILSLMAILNTYLMENKRQAELSSLPTEIQEKAIQTATPDVVSTYLPNVYRAKENSKEDNAAVALRDPFIRGLTLKGLLIGGNGRNLAIIEITDDVHIVGPGDLLGEGWTVLEINKGKVILSDGENSLTLNF